MEHFTRGTLVGVHVWCPPGVFVRSTVTLQRLMTSCELHVLSLFAHTNVVDVSQRRKEVGYVQVSNRCVAPPEVLAPASIDCSARLSLKPHTLTQNISHL